MAGVEDGQPAAKAGLQPGDLITKMGDETVSDAADLTAAIRSLQPGDKVEVTFTRDGDEQTVEVTLGELPRELTGRAVSGRRRDLGSRRRPSRPSGPA